jgi:hypothetical protein
MSRHAQNFIKQTQIPLIQQADSLLSLRAGFCSRLRISDVLVASLPFSPALGTAAGSL